jgi:Kef-type K+ transport system membrane component KefB
MGAVSAPTAPAPILAVVREYKARGPLTSTLLGVVTLDDGVTILFFSIAAALARGLVENGTSLTAHIVIEPLLEIAAALGIGILGGLLLKTISPTLRNRESILVVGLGAVFLVTGTALTVGASPLMAAMVLGFITVNFVRHPDQWFEEVEKLEEPLFAMFFVMAGAHLQVQVLAKAGILTVIVVIVRTVAKFLGAYAGARMGRAPDNVRNLIPIGLLPQAGITLGLVIVANTVLGEGPAGDIIVNVVLASVIVNEIVSPALLHLALAHAGEIPGSEGPGGILE